MIGDARLELENLEPGSFDLLAIDAFSSDAIPLHLLTAEALDIYLDALDTDGLLLMHISNRYIDLEPVLARLAQARGLAVQVRRDVPDVDDPANNGLYASVWVAFAQDPARLTQLTTQGDFDELKPARGTAWSDEFASILPYLRWDNFF